MIWLVIFIQLHTVGGAEIWINPDEVTILRPADKGDPGDKLFTEGVTCVVGTADGKYVTVTEHCDAVRKMLEQPK